MPLAFTQGDPDPQARLEALLTVAASKKVVSRQEVDEEQARAKPTRR